MNTQESSRSIRSNNRGNTHSRKLHGRIQFKNQEKAEFPREEIKGKKWLFIECFFGQALSLTLSNLFLTIKPKVIIVSIFYKLEN